MSRQLPVGKGKTVHRKLPESIRSKNICCRCSMHLQLNLEQNIKCAERSTGIASKITELAFATCTCKSESNDQSRLSQHLCPGCASVLPRGRQPFLTMQHYFR